MTERTAYEHVVQSGMLSSEELVASLTTIWVGAVYGAH